MLGSWGNKRHSGHGSQVGNFHAWFCRRKLFTAFVSCCTDVVTLYTDAAAECSSPRGDAVEVWSRSFVGSGLLPFELQHQTFHHFHLQLHKMETQPYLVFALQYTDIGNRCTEGTPC